MAVAKVGNERSVKEGLGNSVPAEMTGEITDEQALLATPALCKYSDETATLSCLADRISLTEFRDSRQGSSRIGGGRDREWVRGVVGGRDTGEEDHSGIEQREAAVLGLRSRGCDLQLDLAAAAANAIDYVGMTAAGDDTAAASPAGSSIQDEPQGCGLHHGFKMAPIDTQGSGIKRMHLGTHNGRGQEHSTANTGASAVIAGKSHDSTNHATSNHTRTIRSTNHTTSNHTRDLQQHPHKNSHFDSSLADAMADTFMSSGNALRLDVQSLQTELEMDQEMARIQRLLSRPTDPMVLLQKKELELKRGEVKPVFKRLTQGETGPKSKHARQGKQTREAISITDATVLVRKTELEIAIAQAERKLGLAELTNGEYHVKQRDRREIEERIGKKTNMDSAGRAGEEKEPRLTLQRALIEEDASRTVELLKRQEQTHALEKKREEKQAQQPQNHQTLGVQTLVVKQQDNYVVALQPTKKASALPPPPRNAQRLRERAERVKRETGGITATSPSPSSLSSALVPMPSVSAAPTAPIMRVPASAPTMRMPELRRPTQAMLKAKKAAEEQTKREAKEQEEKETKEEQQEKEAKEEQEEKEAKEKQEQKETKEEQEEKETKEEQEQKVAKEEQEEKETKEEQKQKETKEEQKQKVAKEEQEQKETKEEQKHLVEEAARKAETRNRALCVREKVWELARGNAAILIQTAARCNLARREVCVRDEACRAVAQARAESVTVVQSIFRRRLAKITVREQRKRMRALSRKRAATSIQCAFRCYKAVLRSQGLRLVLRKAKQRRMKRASAAMAISRAVRRHRAEVVVNKLRKKERSDKRRRAAVAVQCATRAHQARTHACNLRKESTRRRRYNSATVVAMFFRRCQSLKHLRQLQIDAVRRAEAASQLLAEKREWAAVMIQGAMRRLLAQKCVLRLLIANMKKREREARVVRLNTAALVIECCFRRYTAAVRVCGLERARTTAVIVIQSAVRRHNAALVFDNLRIVARRARRIQAVVRIQTIMARGYQARVRGSTIRSAKLAAIRLGARQAAALRLQCCARKFQATKFVCALRNIRREAARREQAHREAVARKEARQNAALVIESAFRCHQAWLSLCELRLKANERAEKEKHEALVKTNAALLMKREGSAIVLECAFRRHQATQRVYELRQAAEELLLSTKQARAVADMLHQREGAAVVIENSFRRHQAAIHVLHRRRRARAEAVRALRVKAVTMIQSLVRQFRAREHVALLQLLRLPSPQPGRTAVDRLIEGPLNSMDEVSMLVSALNSELGDRRRSKFDNSSTNRSVARVIDSGSACKYHHVPVKDERSCTRSPTMNLLSQWGQDIARATSPTITTPAATSPMSHYWLEAMSTTSRRPAPRLLFQKEVSLAQLHTLDRPTPLRTPPLYPVPRSESINTRAEAESPTTTTELAEVELERLLASLPSSRGSASHTETTPADLRAAIEALPPLQPPSATPWPVPPVPPGLPAVPILSASPLPVTLSALTEPDIEQADPPKESTAAPIISKIGIASVSTVSDLPLQSIGIASVSTVSDLPLQSVRRQSIQEWIAESDRLQALSNQRTPKKAKSRAKLSYEPPTPKAESQEPVCGPVSGGLERQFGQEFGRAITDVSTDAKEQLANERLDQQQHQEQENSDDVTRAKLCLQLAQRTIDSANRNSSAATVAACAPVARTVAPALASNAHAVDGAVPDAVLGDVADDDANDDDDAIFGDAFANAMQIISDVNSRAFPALSAPDSKATAPVSPAQFDKVDDTAARQSNLSSRVLQVLGSLADEHEQQSALPAAPQPASQPQVQPQPRSKPTPQEPLQSQDQRGPEGRARAGVKAQIKALICALDPDGGSKDKETTEQAAKQAAEQAASRSENEVPHEDTGSTIGSNIEGTFATATIAKKKMGIASRPRSKGRDERERSDGKENEAESYANAMSQKTKNGTKKEAAHQALKPSMLKQCKRIAVVATSSAQGAMQGSLSPSGSRRGSIQRRVKRQNEERGDSAPVMSPRSAKKMRSPRKMGGKAFAFERPVAMTLAAETKMENKPLPTTKPPLVPVTPVKPPLVPVTPVDCAPRAHPSPSPSPSSSIASPASSIEDNRQEISDFSVENFDQEDGTDSTKEHSECGSQFRQLIGLFMAQVEQHDALNELHRPEAQYSDYVPAASAEERGDEDWVDLMPSPQKVTRPCEMHGAYAQEQQTKTHSGF
jgi:hypothetical protein